MYRLVKVEEVHANKAGGSALDFRRLDAPRGTNKVKWWARHLGAAPIRHTATPRLDANTSSANFTNTYGTGHADSYFSLAGAGPQQSIGEKIYAEAGDRFEYVFHANGLNPTQFFLRVKWYVWVSD